MQWITNPDGGETPVVETYGCADADLASVLDWMDTAMLSISRLRSGQWRLDGSRDQQTLTDLYTCINDVAHRLTPRLEGVTAALIRAHYEAGGSHGELASAMDTSRATAQTRAVRTRVKSPSVWERWATGEHTTATYLAVDVRPGWSLIYDSGHHTQIAEVRVYDDGYVELETGDREGGAYCYDVGDTVTAVAKDAPGMTTVTGTDSVRDQDIGFTAYALPRRSVRGEN